MEVYTFVAGDTRSSWYKYSDGPLPTLAMRNFSVKKKPKTLPAMAVVQWVRAFAPQAEGWVFKSQPRQI